MAALLCNPSGRRHDIVCPACTRQRCGKRQSSASSCSITFRAVGVVLATLLAVAAPVPTGAILKAKAEDDRLIGWQGESYRPAPKPVFKTLSWSPRIFHAEDLLTPEEVKHLIRKAEPRVARSGVVDTDTGGSAVSDIRTSSGMFFARGEDPVIEGIEARLADWLMVPAYNGEGIQVLKYEKTQHYDAHFDYFFHREGLDNGGNRLVTVLMYLSDVAEGGETVFPNVPVPPGQTRESFSECAMKGLAVKPKAGSAVAFWSLQTDGRLDQGSLHGGCPVIRGVKYAATKWVHVARVAVGGEQAVRVEHVVHVPPPPPAPPGCANLDERCGAWAESGECKANRPFMVGTKEQPGACLFACERCDLGPNAPLGGGVNSPGDPDHPGDSS